MHFRKEQKKRDLISFVGGPGGGCDEQDREFFNPEKYKVRNVLSIRSMLTSNSLKTQDHPFRPKRLRKINPVRIQQPFAISPTSDDA